MFYKLKKLYNYCKLDQGITYDDIVLIPQLNKLGSRLDIDLSSVDKKGKLKLDIPIFTANMETITELDMCHFIERFGGKGCLHRIMTLEDMCYQYKKSPSNTFVSIGAGKTGLKQIERLYSCGARYFNLDVAHAHSNEVGETLKEIKKIYKDIYVMSGNVCTYEGARFLEEHGADIIKVGIGGGSSCVTRVKTGFGLPNLISIQEASKVSVSIVADGGIRKPSDMVKALAFGADFVMIGGLLAGTRPTPNSIIEKDGKNFKIFRGLDSRSTHEEKRGGLRRGFTTEGEDFLVPYRTDEVEIIEDLVGGLRSALSYCGAKNIREMQKKKRYMKVSNSSLIEGDIRKEFLNVKMKN